MRDITLESLKKLSVEDLAALASAGAAAGHGGATGAAAHDSLPPLTGKPPLSFAQERLWFMDRLAPMNPFYNIAYGLRIDGPLDADALGAAWLDVIRRHDTLSAVFPADSDGYPSLASIEAEQCAVSVADISDLPDTEQETILDQAREREATLGFSLETGPLVRATLYRTAPDSFTFLYTFHHIVFDGWSVAVFMNDLFQAYAARARGESPVFEPLPATYPQYALWQRQKLRSPETSEEFAWWRDYLAETREVEVWPDFPRPANQSFRGATREFTTPPKLRAAMESLASRHGATGFMAWLAVYSVVLARMSGRRELVMGNSVAGRDHQATEKLVGFFINNLVVKVTADQQRSFAAHLESVRDSVLTSFEHGELPFQFLAQGLGRHLDLSRNPIYQNGFTYQNMPRQAEHPNGLRLEPVSVPVKATHLDLHLLMWPEENDLSCSLIYATDLYTRETADAFVQAFLETASAAVADPEITLAALFRNPAAFSGRGRKESIISAPDAGYPFVPPWEHIQESVLERPDSPAFILSDDMREQIPTGSPVSGGTEVISYSRFAGMVERLATDLTPLPFGKGRLTAILLPSGLEMLTAMLAVWRQGGAWLSLDPDHPPLRQCELLRNSGASLLISTKEIAAGLGLEQQGLGDLTVFDTPSWRDAAPAANPVQAVRPDPDDLACVYHTSGSTGIPKGVRITYGNINHRMTWEATNFPLGKNDLLCMKSAPVFVDFLCEIFPVLFFGAPTLLLGHGASRDPARLVSKMEQYGATKVVMVTSLLKAIHQVCGGLEGRLAGLRYLRTSGEPMEIRLAAETIRSIPGLSIVNTFGSTEMFNPTAFHLTAENLPTVDPDGIIPAGLPLPGRVTALLDENLLPVPWGEQGVIYSVGPGVTPGYLNGVGEDAFHDLDIAGETRRFFCSGDLGRLDDLGRLHYLGRQDHQIKIRGVRIEAGEVRAHILSFRGVQDALVTAWKDGDGNARLVGFVILPQTPAAESAGMIQALREHLLERLPAAMIPDVIRLLDEWPRTASGKIDRPALLRQFTAESGQPEPPAPAEAGAVEQKIIREWQDIIGLGQTMSSRVNFFEAGGNSLLLVTLHERLQRLSGASFPLTELFSNPTIESQARLLSGLASRENIGERQPARRLPDKGSLVAGRLRARSGADA